jgi:hypothetical protein
VQVLLDDDDPAFDRTLLDAPLVAAVHDANGSMLAREPFDHDAFRRQLRYERDAGESFTRGVLVTTRGQLPPPWVRLAFLPLTIASTTGCELVISQTTVDALRHGVERAFADGEITDADRRALLASIEQRHPGD